MKQQAYKQIYEFKTLLFEYHGITPLGRGVGRGKGVGLGLAIGLGFNVIPSILAILAALLSISRLTAAQI